MSENNSSEKALVIPSFGKSPALVLDMGKIKEGESRYLEAKMVNPSSYADLEHSFNESYRDLKQHVSSIGHQLNMALKALGDAKADVILGAYAEYLTDKPKSMDSTARMEAFLSRDKAYSDALDRVNQLKALESYFDGKIKVVENVCRYMRKKMDLIIRSGLVDAGGYSGKR